jgi:hypothetical protein
MHVHYTENQNHNYWITGLPLQPAHRLLLPFQLQSAHRLLLPSPLQPAYRLLPTSTQAVHMHTGTGNGTGTSIGTHAAHRLRTGARAVSTPTLRLLAHKHTSIQAAHRLHTGTHADSTQAHRLLAHKAAIAKLTAVYCSTL